MKSSRPAFTIIELLVVIGIIGILAGVLLSSFSGGTESARAAKCLANMRNLAQGAISYAAKNKHGLFPYAGSHAKIDQKLAYTEHVGWISWLSINDEYYKRGKDGGPARSFQKCDNISAFCDDDDKAAFAITNGALWNCVGQNRETYVCPSHAILAKKHGKGHKLKVRFSYAMSAFFGYDWTKGTDAATDGDGGVSMNGSDVRLDRTLLFAELPFAIQGTTDSSNKVDEDTAYSTANNTYLIDCTLQYSATINGKSYYGGFKEWNGTAEAIAFNHKSGKRYCAHVAFADGHVERLLMPKAGSGGLNAAQLTAALCGGKDGFHKGGVDVSFSDKNSSYDLITDGDK